MSRISAAIFSFLILLSSGLVQFVVHVCPKDGLMLSEAGCNMHEMQQKSCCEEKGVRVEKTDDGACCTDDYLFIVSPKYGSIQHLETTAPVFFYLSDCDLVISTHNPSLPAFHSFVFHSPPGNSGKQILTEICTLSI